MFRAVPFISKPLIQSITIFLPLREGLIGTGILVIMVVSDNCSYEGKVSKGSVSLVAGRNIFPDPARQAQNFADWRNTFAYIGTSFTTKYLQVHPKSFPYG